MRTRVIFTWGIFGLLVIIIATIAPARIYVIKGRQHLAAGQYQEAVTDYQHATRLSPTFARAYVELGDAYRQLAKYDEAEKAFKKAISFEDEACAFCGLGFTCWKTGRYVEAEKAFKRAMELNPNDSCAYDYSGRMYYDLGRYQEAAEVFQQEIRLWPNVNGYLFLGNAYTYLGRFGDAVSAYRNAIRLEPDEVMAYTQLGVAYDYLKQYGAAIEAWQHALRLKPNDAKAHRGLIRAYLAVGDKRAAFEHAEIASRLEERTVYFIPLGDFSLPATAELATYYKRKFGIGIVGLPTIPLDPSTLDPRRRQLIAEEVIELIKRRYPKLAEDPKAILIGLTERDMYIREKNWQYAFSYWVASRFAVVSSARMNPVNLGQPASPELLNARVRKMVMKDIGVLYYQMQPNNNPKSVLYRSINGLEDLDGMGEEF
jgi:Flp pilus assembly protein TadD/predicted Zn-dependent protease